MNKETQLQAEINLILGKQENTQNSQSQPRRSVCLPGSDLTFSPTPVENWRINLELLALPTFCSVGNCLLSTRTFLQQ